MSVSLANLLVPEKVVAVEFPGMEGFTVELCHMSRTELVAMRKKCVTSKWDRNLNAPIENLDEEKFVRVYCKAVVRGWSGFKFKYLEELLLVDISSQDPEDELEFTEENLVMLMKNSQMFESWVNTEVGNLENFTKSK